MLGVKTFEQSGDVYIFLILLKYHIDYISEDTEDSYMFPRKQNK